MIPGDRALEILLEVTLGKRPRQEDTAEEAEYRTQTRNEVEEIRRKGWIVEIPGELP